MPAEDKYMEWLEREEDVLGLDATVRASMDVDYATMLLEQELGYTPTDKQLDAFMGIGQTKYEMLPQISVSVDVYERDYGMQVVYRDVTTGRFVSWQDITAALKLLKGGG